MFRFFQGWQRKVGVVTLLMALVFMSGWVRSSTMFDAIVFPVTLQKSDSKVSVSFDTLQSAKGSIAWERAHEESSKPDEYEGLDLGPSYPRWQSSSATSDLDWNTPGLKWRWRVLGLGVAEYAHVKNAWVSLLLVPYWVIVVPLTLISGCLVLRRAKPANRAGDDRAAVVAKMAA